MCSQLCRTNNGAFLKVRPLTRRPSFTSLWEFRIQLLQIPSCIHILYSDSVNASVWVVNSGLHTRTWVLPLVLFDVWPKITVIKLSKRYKSPFNTSGHSHAVITSVARLSGDICWSVCVVLIKLLTLPFMFALLFHVWLCVCSDLERVNMKLQCTCTLILLR